MCGGLPLPHHHHSPSHQVTEIQEHSSEGRHAFPRAGETQAGAVLARRDLMVRGCLELEDQVILPSMAEPKWVFAMDQLWTSWKGHSLESFGRDPTQEDCLEVRWVPQREEPPEVQVLSGES